MRIAVPICAIALVGHVAIAGPAMPMGFKAAVSNDTGKTWRETGTLAQPLAMARVAVRSSMVGQGYALVHDIAESENAPRRFQLWRRGQEDVILMIWQEDPYTTGISWGLSERNGEGSGPVAAAIRGGSDSIATNRLSDVILPTLRQPGRTADVDLKEGGRTP